VSDFKKLKVWRKGHALALNVHRVALQIRGPDNAALRNQMLRASMSIPTNIVEGTGQQGQRQFARFIGFSLNSTSELEYHLIVARDAAVITRSDAESLLDQTIEVRKMLHGLLNKILTLPRKATEKSQGVVNSQLISTPLTTPARSVAVKQLQPKACSAK
jgi:four helix bundle protein